MPDVRVQLQIFFACNFVPLTDKKRGAALVFDVISYVKLNHASTKIKLTCWYSIFSTDNNNNNINTVK